jgi:hypothetical protein
MQQSERIRVLVRQRSAKCVRMARNDASSLGSLAEAAAATRFHCDVSAAFPGNREIDSTARRTVASSKCV